MKLTSTTRDTIVLQRKWARQSVVLAAMLVLALAGGSHVLAGEADPSTDVVLEGSGYLLPGGTALSSGTEKTPEQVRIEQLLSDSGYVVVIIPASSQAVSGGSASFISLEKVLEGSGYVIVEPVVVGNQITALTADELLRDSGYLTPTIGSAEVVSAAPSASTSPYELLLGDSGYLG